MFVRKVSVRLQPNTLQQFTSVMESEILPWLRIQDGFIDLVTLASPDGCEIQALSFWDQGGNAQAYSSSGYPAVLNTLASLLDGVPSFKTFEVVVSTLDGFTRSRTEMGGELQQSSSTQLDCSV